MWLDRQDQGPDGPFSLEAGFTLLALSEAAPPVARGATMLSAKRTLGPGDDSLPAQLYPRLSAV